jgi:hypothetical protein
MDFPCTRGVAEGVKDSVAGSGVSNCNGPSIAEVAVTELKLPRVDG